MPLKIELNKSKKTVLGKLLSNAFGGISKEDKIKQLEEDIKIAKLEKELEKIRGEKK